MPNAFHYRATLHRLAALADSSDPHVCVSAAGVLARELSPANPRRPLVQQLLREADPYEFARHRLRDLYDGADPLSPEPSTADLTEVPTEEQAPEEEEDPL